MKEKLDSMIEKAVQILKGGGVVVFPTDTVYGVGCRIDCKKAIRRIYQIKRRDYSVPFPILLGQKKDIFNWAKVSPKTKKLMDQFWPGALTLVLPTKLKVLPILKNKKGGASFRLPNHNLALNLIKKVGVPIVGTSANFHSKDPAKKSTDLDTEFTSLCDFIIEGECQIGVESTVLDLIGKLPKILREGAIKEKDIDDALN